MDGKAASGGSVTGTLGLGLGAGVRVSFSHHQLCFRTSEARGRVSLRRRQTRTAGVFALPLSLLLWAPPAPPGER